jgi:hypothetical protein
VFLETKNGKARRIPLSPAIDAVLGAPAWRTCSGARSRGPASPPAMSRCIRCGIPRSAGWWRTAVTTTP